MELKGIVGKKVAGVPVVYLAALFVGILVIVAWRMKPAAEESDAGGDPASENGVDGDPDPYENPTFTANPTPAYVAPAAGDPTVGNITIATNEQWARKSAEWLVSTGRTTGGNALTTMYKYINGDQLSYEEGKLRDAAIKQWGTPPETFTPGQTKNPASAIASKQGNPPTVHTIKGPNDNNYWKIARLYYGSSHYDYVNTLEVANINLPKLESFPVGTKIKIPKYYPPKYFLATATINTAQQIASRNGTSAAVVLELNDSVKWPAKKGQKIRVA